MDTQKRAQIPVLSGKIRLPVRTRSFIGGASVKDWVDENMQLLSIWHSAIVVILLCACVARVISLVKDRSSVMPVTGPSGFGGWLALVAIGVFVWPPVTIVKMSGITSGFEDFDFQEFWFMLDGDIGIHLAVIFMQICTVVFMVLRSNRFVSVYIVTSICMILL